MRRSRSTAKRLSGSARPTSSAWARTPSNSCRQNEECCVAPQTMTVNVARPNNPGEVQTVRGTIEFKPALVEFQGLPGTTRQLRRTRSFNGPGQRKIPMATAALHAQCRLFSPPTSGLPPKEFDLTLSPGRTLHYPRAITSWPRGVPDESVALLYEPRYVGGRCSLRRRSARKPRLTDRSSRSRRA